MRNQNIIFILFLSSFIIAFRQKTKIESGNFQTIDMTSYEIIDDVGPPPHDLTSNFKTIQDWLINICDDKKPKKTITNYEIGLFESPKAYTLYLVGVYKDVKGDTSYTRIVFEPTNMYFQFPSGEYKNLERVELNNRLFSQLKDFTDSKKFKSSFLIEADKIIFTPNGETIWSKPK